MTITTANEKIAKEVSELIYNEKKEFYDQLLGSKAQKYIYEALLEDIPPFTKSRTFVLMENDKVKSVLLYATKADFRHGYQKWFRILGFKIIPIGSKMIYIIERILMDFSVDDLYIISLSGEMKEFLLYKFMKSNRYKRIIIDTFEPKLFESFGFEESKPVHVRMKRLLKLSDYQTMTGFGWDTHPIAENKKLILGGVQIESDVGLLGHSDADVLAHAIIDSILGITYKVDIGVLFPENEKNKGRKSIEMLDEVVKMVISSGFFLSSIDCVIISSIRLKNYREKIVQNLESICNCQVSIKFKSGNDVYPESQQRGITAMCVSTIDKI
ncbi:MAG: 2-C-methyl-D-erythritol 2,4-cyclodiphosphate synthase [Fervidobacterium sp.]